MSRKLQSPVTLLVILAVMNVINYADRALLSPLAPLLAVPRDHGGLGLSNSEIGLIASAFMVVHSLASVPLGILADRYLRTRLIAAGVALWSLATATAGFARDFGQLFVARASVGIGEATYAPAATALISEKFTPAARARALGIFQVGSVLGGAVAQVVGGQVAGAWGWRAAFYVFGFPGLLIALSILLYDEKPRQAAERPRTPRASQSLAIEARGLARNPAFVWINLAGVFITFFVGALIVFANKFVLDYHYGGDKAFNATVSLNIGVVGAVASILGTLTGSFVGDRIERRHPGAGRLIAVAISALATIPCAVAAMYVSTALLYPVLGLGVFFMTWYLGPVMASLHDSVPPDKRGTATGIYLLLVHLLGDAISPTIVGTIADRFGGLRVGLLAAMATLVLGAACALYAIRSRRPSSPT